MLLTDPPLQSGPHIIHVRMEFKVVGEEGSQPLEDIFSNNPEFFADNENPKATILTWKDQKKLRVAMAGVCWSMT